MKLPGFKKRPAYSLLFVTEAKTFRIDADRAGNAVGDIDVFDVNCPTTAKLAECVDRIAASKRALGRKTWLLYVRLPVAVLSLPTMQVEGVEEASLIQALQFELEGLSGESMIDMQTAYRLLGEKNEMSTYQVYSLNRLQLEDLHKAVKKAGSTLAGVLHPAALPVALSNPEAKAWLRLECWPNQLAAIRSDDENSLSLRLFSFDNRHWQSHLEQWLTDQGRVERTETLLNNKIELLPETDYSLHLATDDAVSAWLALWAGVLQRKAPPAPLLRYRSNLNTDLLSMASGAAAALLICSGHLGWHLYQTRHFTEEYENLKKVETSIAALRKSLTGDREQVEKLRQKIDKLKGDSNTLPQMIKALQQRPARLLESVALGRPENLLLEKIDQEDDTVKLSGISLDSVSANILASYLEDKLDSLGWRIIAPTKRNMQAFEGGGPWEFTIAIEDAGIEGFSQ